MRFARYASPGEGPFEYWSSFGNFSVTVWQSGVPGGIGLRGVSGGANSILHYPRLELPYSWTIGKCEPTLDSQSLVGTTIGGPGEVAMWSIYELGTLAAGQKKTVKHVYSRM